MAKIFFFCGSSSVGKSTTLNLLDKDQFEIVSISARDVRARLNNPSWDDLMTQSALAKHHQQYILESFMDSIFYAAEHHREMKNGRIMVFERSLWDVVGYLSAYKGTASEIEEQVEKVLAFEEELLKNNSAEIVRFPISQSYRYEAIPERPPEIIRDLCDDWLIANWERSYLSYRHLMKSEFSLVEELQLKMREIVAEELV